MNKEEEQWVDAIIERKYNIRQMQELLKNSNYSEEKIKEFSEYYIRLMKQELQTPLSLPKKRFNFGRSLNIFKKKAVKIILFITIVIPIWLYLLTISPKITGAVLGITIIFLLIGIIYLGIKRKMNKEMEIVHNVRYPTREPTEDNSGIGGRVESSPEGKGIGRSNREPKRRKKLQVESPSKNRQTAVSDTKPDRADEPEYERIREGDKKHISDVPDLE